MCGAAPPPALFVRSAASGLALDVEADSHSVVVRSLHGEPNQRWALDAADRDDVHEYLCGLHFGWKPKRKPGGRTEDVPIRTTTVDADGNRDVIDGDEFWRYVEFVQRFGAKLGIVIPDPDPNYKIKRKA